MDNVNITVRPRGKHWQIDFRYNGKRILRNAPEGSTEQQAKDLGKQWLMDLVGNNPEGITRVPGNCWTLEMALDECWKSEWENGRSARFFKANIASLKAYFKEATPISKIHTDWISQYALAAMAKQKDGKPGLSGATVNRKLCCLSKALTFAAARSITSGYHKSQIPDFQWQAETKGRTRFLTDAEELAMEAYYVALVERDDKYSPKRQKHADFFLTLLDTGFRVGELLRVKPRDCNMVDPRGKITAWETKNGEPRTVPMTRRVRAIMERRLEGVSNDVRVFDHTGSWVKRAWEGFRKHMGMLDDPEFVPHSLRHTCATRLIERDANPRTVQKWLGHSNFETTERYVHLNDRMLNDAVELLDAEPQTSKVVGTAERRRMPK